jgi:hypothetical protein
MIFEAHPFTAGDYSERTLVAKILLAHFFNASAKCNQQNGEAFRGLVKLTTGMDASDAPLGELWGTIEFGVVRSVKSFDNTQLDALFGVGRKVICAVECKYCDPFKLESNQFARVAQATLALAKVGGYQDCFMTLVAPEQEFASIATDPQRIEVRDSIRSLIERAMPRLSIVSWEILFEAMCRFAPEDSQRLARFIGLRNEDKTYAIKLSMVPKVASPEAWSSIMAGKSELPKTLVVPANWPPKNRAPRATTEVEELFLGLEQIRPIFDQFLAWGADETTGNIKALSRKKGRYINILSDHGPGQNDFLVFPAREGLSLIFNPKKVRSAPSNMEAFEAWRYASQLKGIHQWFRTNEKNLAVISFTPADWMVDAVRISTEHLIREIIRNRRVRM